MNTRFWYECCLKIGIVLAATSGYLCSQRAIAQIVPDRTLGAESSIVTPNVDIKGVPSDRIDAGAIRGANLFHSFQEFNIREGRGAYFSNPAGIENIFSRVTGTNASNIFGKLGVLGNANLFLLNPNGIIFGPNASLDINGSFSASTGNSFNFGDEKFSATNPTNAPLLSVKVPLGVQFNQNQPSAIANSGNLSVGTGQNLNLIGGTVVSTGQLSAPGGQVAVAAVPGGSVVNLSPSAQFLNVETSSPVSSVSSSSLNELLTSVDERERPGLTVNSNGQVELTGSGLPVVDGDVVARNVTAQTATLTANNNLTLVESQLGTTGDLNLLARDTVRVRDSVANPFVAQAGGNLTIRGDQGIDILALNHPQTPFVSGGNLSLISDGNISGDAHFASGASFSILNLAGQPGNFVSLYDPIISADGDVVFGNYTGAALKVESTGRIIGRDITITGPDSALPPNPNDPDVDILRTSRAVILRAGLPSLVYGDNIPIPAGGTNFASPSTSSSLPPGSIQVRNINTSNAGNAGSVIMSASGIITTGNIRSVVEDNSTGRAGNISLEAGGDITVSGNIEAFVAQGSTGQGGNITLVSSNGSIDTIQGFVSSVTTQGDSGNIEMTAPLGNITTANVYSYVGAEGSGRGGTITLRSGVDEEGNVSVGLPSGIGIIDTTTKINDPNNPNIRPGIYSNTPNGVGGNITLTAAGNIRSGSIEASSNSNDQGFSTITLNSSTGSVFLNGVRLSTTNTGSGFAGDIFIRAGNNIEITGNRRFDANRNEETGDFNLSTEGFFGRIFINAGGKVSITNSRLSAQIPQGQGTPVNENLPGKIQVTSQNGNIEINNSGVNASTLGQGNAGNINIDATNGSVSVTGGSQLQALTNGRGNAGNVIINARDTVTFDNSFAFATVQENGIGNGGYINIGTSTPTGSVLVTNGSQLQALTNGQGDAGNVIINARDTVTFDNSFAFAIVGQSGIGQGGYIGIGISEIGIPIPTGSVFVTNGSQLQALTNGQGDAGNVIINARDTVTFDNGFAFATVGEKGNGAGGDIRISIPTGSLAVRNSGQLQALTDGQGDAGNVIINARDTVTFDNGFAFATVGEKGNGAGGDIRISIPTGSLEVTNSGRVSATNFAQGRAGDVSVRANSVLLRGTNPNTDFRKIFENNQTPQEGLLAEATNGGTAGNLFIFANELRIENGAAATVSSPTGQAGNLVVFAKEIFLNNGALLATTGREGNDLGANIFILGNEGNETTLVQSVKDLVLLISNNKLGEQGKRSLPGSPLDFLILGNESRIATDAVNSANGGNIAIKTRLLLALPPTGKNGNDISANAKKTGTGGVVAIDPRPFGIYGTEFRPKTENTPLNDITASSEQGPQGTVAIVPIDADPKRGILQLPELGDSPEPITQSCPVGRTQAASSFTVTGRGGLPPSPSSALSSDALMGTTTNASPRESRSIQSSSPGSTLVEAKGVNIGPKGEIIFTANPSKSTSDNSWQRNTGCNAQ